MKLFLNGGGSSVQAAGAYEKFNEVIDHAKPLLYIPLAMESEKYPGCLKWIEEELTKVDIPGIEMVTSGTELAKKDLNQYCALFIGGGNTYKLLNELKATGAFDKIKKYIHEDGIVFGGSAGAIIFGKSIETSEYADRNNVNLMDLSGFDMMSGMSLFCHYDKNAKDYLLKASQNAKIMALPEDDTLYFNGTNFEVIGSKAYAYYEKGICKELGIKEVFYDIEVPQINPNPKNDMLYPNGTGSGSTISALIMIVIGIIGLFFMYLAYTRSDSGHVSMIIVGIMLGYNVILAFALLHEKYVFRKKILEEGNSYPGVIVNLEIREYVRNRHTYETRYIMTIKYDKSQMTHRVDYNPEVFLENPYCTVYVLGKKRTAADFKVKDCYISDKGTITYKRRDE